MRRSAILSNDVMPSRRRAIRQKGQITSPRRKGTNNLPIKLPMQPLTEDEAIEGFSAAIVDLSVGEISSAGKITKEASKKYQQRHSLPRVVPLINMARNIPAVNKWLKAMIDSGEYEPDEPQLLSELHELLSRHTRQ